MSDHAVEVDYKFPFFAVLPAIQVDLDEPIPLHGPANDVTAVTRLDLMVCPLPNPEQRLIQKNDPALEIAKVFAKLTAREKQVIMLQAEGLSNVEIASQLGMSRERVRQIGEDVRMVAHGYERRVRSTEAYQKRGCAVCGKSLAGQREGRIFCSDKCRHKSFRDKRRAVNAADILCHLR